MRRVSGLALALALAALAAAPARAQEADSAASAFDAPDERVTPRRLAPFGDLRLRGDFVTGLPAGREDLERGRATIRAGLRATPWPLLDVDASLRGSLATDHNADRRRNFDNERPDALELDRASLRVRADRHWTVVLGKLEMPLRLTALTWDEDLRPIGIATSARWALGRRDALRWASAGVVGDRFVGDDESWIYAAQVAWLARENAPTGGEVALAYLTFDGLERDSRKQLQRQNTVFPQPGGRLAAEFGLIDLQVAGRAPLVGRPANARVDLVHNHRTSLDRSGVRARFAWGETGGLGAWEVGYVFQRIERDAVPGSFNSDDWWFHSADRGHSAFVAVGLGAATTLRVSGFVERRDDLLDTTRRLLVELTGRLDPR